MPLNPANIQAQRDAAMALRFKPYLTDDQAVLAYAGTYEPAAEIADMPRAEQELRITIDLYAHIYTERCREFFCARLISERGLQAAWQAVREDLVAGVVAEIAPAAAARRAA